MEINVCKSKRYLMSLDQFSVLKLAREKAVIEDLHLGSINTDTDMATHHFSKK